MEKIDKQIISLISQDIPLVEKPFEDLAAKLGIEEKELISRIKSYKKNGLMRKLSGVMNHRKIGFKYNAMVVWDIPEEYVEESGKKIASFPEVTHCYERKRFPQWNYTLYSMVHGTTKSGCIATVEKIAKKIGYTDYKILFSSKEYKKTGVKY